MNLVFAAIAIFVVTMLIRAFLPHTMPGEGKLREKISPQLRNFIESLPLPADHPLASDCLPWKPAEPRGRPKAFLPLWQDREGNPSYYSTYIKLGSKPTFHGLMETENEQAFLAVLILTVMQRQFASDRPQAIDLGRRAADAVGFLYFDEATKFLSTWRAQPQPDSEDDDAPYVFAHRIEKIAPHRKDAAAFR